MSRIDPRDYDCRPYVTPSPVDVDTDGAPLSILALSSRASLSAERWRAMMDARAPLVDTLRASRDMTRAIDALTTAIVDSVAVGQDSLTTPYATLSAEHAPTLPTITPTPSTDADETTTPTSTRRRRRARADTVNVIQSQT